MAVTNSLVAKGKQKMGLTTYLTQDAVKNQINSIIGGKNGDKFITAIVSAVQANPALQECTNQSILSAALLGQSLNLSPSPQMSFYYLVPYNSKQEMIDERGNKVKVDVKVAQFQLGYKGYVQLATRSGVYRKLNVLAIKEGELVKFDPLNEEIEVNLIPDEEKRENTPTVAYYAMFEYLNGFKKAICWSKSKMLAHADRYSKAFNKEVYQKIQEGKIPQSEMWKYSSPWYASFDDMACKTMLRQLISRWGLMSSELEKAYTSDMGVIGENGSVTYVDNDNTVTEAPVAPAEPKEEPIMPPPEKVQAEVVEPPKKKVEKKGAPETPEEAAAIAESLFK